MNLALETIDVWTFHDDFPPAALLRQLGTLLRDGDVIALGAYSPSERLCASQTALGAMDIDADAIYSVTFECNRVEHPNGRAFEFPINATILAALIGETLRTDGQDDKPLFFDHLVAYRRGIPVVPLLCFHDAFNGGQLLVSGLYSEAAIRTFATGLPSAYNRNRNPEN